jgi:hypothetical protein
MKTPRDFRRQQRSAVFTALLMFAFVLIILQLWLFVSALEQILAGRSEMAAPAAAISFICLGVNIWMLVGIGRMERSD